MSASRSPARLRHRLGARLDGLRPHTLGLPGPGAAAMASGFRSIRDDPLGFLVDTRARYGDLVAFPVPGPPVLLVNDPADVRRVLQTGGRHWTKRTAQYAALAAVTGPGLLASAEPDWLARRRAAQPAFHHDRLAGLVGHLADATATVSRQWAALPGREMDGGAVVDVEATSMGLALDIIGRTLFDHDLAGDTRRVVEATDAAAELIVARGRAVVPLPGWVPTRVNRRMRTAAAELDGVCRAVVVERRRRGVGDSDRDLLGLLIAAGLPDDAIRDELVTMVVAGHETVASALTWTLMLLAEHPAAQDRLRREVAAAGSPGPGGPAGTDLRAALPWTRAVIDESLRIFPPGWAISRRTTRADVLGGRDVPVGTMAIVSPWLLHRRPDSWPDPERFDPGRFTGGGSTTARADYLPFGLGPRLCIGRDFALLELTAILAGLLREHEVSLVPGFTRPAVDAFVTARPRGGLRLVVSPAS